ncbi:MAG TPA: GNAT family N-acetyltransferase [Ktedonobacterales bacterium]|jgi:ribosomal protein S18 acetylase RimI-like enzyme|nr:GNAT family N-acetyltransferase [Ktedonobacterales bacterium]
MEESHQNTGELVVRRARPEDRDTVLAFCAHTWDDGDYIAEVWDEWVTDEHNALLVGVLDGTPVALEHVCMVGADEAWLEGMRVDPAYRRHGFGRVMVSRALVAAREMGATVARLLTSDTNVASQRLVERFGLVKVAEMVRYRAPALNPEEGEDAARLTTPGEQAFERIWAWLEQSNLAPLNGGLEITDWHAEALTEPLLRRCLAARQVALLEEWDTFGALAVALPHRWDETDPWTLEVRYIDGLADAIDRLAYALRKRAAELNCTTVELWLPNVLILRDAMAGAGYERHGDHAHWIYTREL